MIDGEHFKKRLQRIGDSIQTARVARRETLREVASRTGLTVVDVSQVEGGEPIGLWRWLAVVDDAYTHGWQGIHEVNDR